MTLTTFAIIFLAAVAAFVLSVVATYWFRWRRRRRKKRSAWDAVLDRRARKKS